MTTAIQSLLSLVRLARTNSKDQSFARILGSNENLRSYWDTDT